MVLFSIVNNLIYIVNNRVCRKFGFPSESCLPVEYKNIKHCIISNQQVLQEL